MGYIKMLARRFGVKSLSLSECKEICLSTLQIERRPLWSTGGTYCRSIDRLIKCFGDVPIASLDKLDIQKFIDYLQGEGLKKSTIQTYYHGARSVFRIVHDLGYIRVNPCRITYTIDNEPKAKRRVSLDQMDDMIQSSLSVRDEAIMRIQKDSAARSNEIRMMKISTTRIRHYYENDKKERVWVHWNDVVPDGKEVRMFGISKITHAKRESGYIKFHHDACVALIRYKNSRKHIKTDWLWLSKRSELLGRTAFYMIFKVAGRRIGLPKCSPHQWRHGVAIHMRREGVDFADIADLLNHKDPALTIREYGQLTEEEKIDRYLDITSKRLSKEDEFPQEFGGWFE